MKNVFLQTKTKKYCVEISNGCAEIIRYGMICDASLLDIITAPLGDKLPEIIARELLHLGLMKGGDQ